MEEGDDTFIAEGYLTGPSLGSMKDGMTFKITKTFVPRDEEAVTIGKYDALPSSCPWLLYRVKLRKPRSGSVYTIEYIDCCSARRVYKREVITHLVTQRKMDEKRVKQLMQQLPPQIDKYETISSLVPDERLQESLQLLLYPAFQGPLYYELLRYFSATFLAKFNDEQLMCLCMVLIHSPYTFCFWDHTRRVLKKFVRPDGTKYIPDDLLVMDDAYATFIGPKLLNRTTRTIEFSSKFPVWSLNCAERACTQWVNDVMFDQIDTILRASQFIYIEMDKAYYSFGNTCMYVSKWKKELNDILQKALDFMSSEGIILFPLGDQGRHEMITKPHNEFVEYDIAIALEKKFVKVHTVNSSLYGSSYIKHFNDNRAKNTDSTPPDRVLFVSANLMTASYMSKATGLKFLACDKVKAGDFKNKTCLVVDKIQKISAIHFLALLQLANRSMMLYALGDPDDFFTHSRRGGGDILQPLFSKFPPEEWHKWELDDPMRKTYECLADEGGINFANIHAVPLDKPKVLLDYIKSLKQAKDNMAYNVFCATEKDKEELMGHVCKSIGGNEHKFDKNVFMLGQKVFVLEDDYCGILLGAADEKDPKKQLNSKDINVMRGRYILDIGGRKYNTSQNTFRHADVQVISRFHGAPAPYGIFYVSKDTNRKHLRCAAKYTTKELKLFTEPNVNMMEIKEGQHIRPVNDLFSKFHKMRLQA